MATTVRTCREDRDWESVGTLPDVIRQVERSVGPVDFILGGGDGTPARVDVLHVPPGARRPFHTLVTSGMSDVPLTLPHDARGAGVSPYVELFLLLPPAWTPSPAWPVRLLRDLARHAHRKKTWLGCGHRIRNRDPPAPYASGVGFCAALLTRPVSLELRPARSNRGWIVFLQVVPLYREELEFADTYSPDALIARFVQYRMSDVIDPERRNVCRLGAQTREFRRAALLTYSPEASTTAQAQRRSPPR